MPPELPLASFVRLATPANIATAIIALNFIAFAAFGVDKALAENGRRRIRESTLPPR